MSHDYTPPAINGTNGRYHSPLPPVAASSFQPIEVWLKPQFAEGSGYPDDWLFLFWKNHPMRLRRKFFSTDENETVEDRYEVFTALVPAHNGWSWTDREGVQHEYPPPTERDFWDQIGLDLLIAMMSAMTDEISALPNSPSTTNPNSPSTSSSETAAATRQRTPSRGRTRGRK